MWLCWEDVAANVGVCFCNHWDIVVIIVEVFVAIVRVVSVTRGESVVAMDGGCCGNSQNGICDKRGKCCGHSCRMLWQ